MTYDRCLEYLSVVNLQADEPQTGRTQTIKHSINPGKFSRLFCLFVCFSSCLNFYFSACPNCFLVLTFFTDYKEVFKVQIDRKNRSLGRIFKRQPVKFEVKYERYGLVAVPIFINTSFLVSGRPVFAGCCADNQRGSYIPPGSGD